ncbi:hypothetical protein E4U58_002208 [Claviceps cyperi]|nr:hypothetical protein E4U58_002208 [Claviceps cyperi]
MQHIPDQVDWFDGGKGEGERERNPETLHRHAQATGLRHSPEIRDSAASGDLGRRCRESLVRIGLDRSADAKKSDFVWRYIRDLESDGRGRRWH